MFNNIVYSGQARLSGLKATYIHSDSVEFMFCNGAIGRIISADMDWRVEYIKDSVYMIYSNCDDIKPSQMISILKNMINMSTIGKED